MNSSNPQLPPGRPAEPIPPPLIGHPIVDDTKCCTPWFAQFQQRMWSILAGKAGLLTQIKVLSNQINGLLKSSEQPMATTTLDSTLLTVVAQQQLFIIAELRVLEALMVSMMEGTAPEDPERLRAELFPVDLDAPPPD